MTDLFNRQIQATLVDPANIVIPTDAQALARGGVAHTRAAFATWGAVAQSGAGAMKEIMQVGHSSVETFGERILNNTKAATDMAFDTAEKIARATTIHQVAQLQAKFAQDQLAIAGQQGRGLIELAAKIAQETTDTLTAMATKVSSGLKVTA